MLPQIVMIEVFRVFPVSLTATAGGPSRYILLCVCVRMSVYQRVCYTKHLLGHHCSHRHPYEDKENEQPCVPCILSSVQSRAVVFDLLG